jgi:hypothetical protein
VVQRREESRRRWKILCLVRSTAAGEDLADDEEVRRERVREKVDEWMGSFVSRMRRLAVEEASSPSATLAVPNGGHVLACGADHQMSVVGAPPPLPPLPGLTSRSKLQVTY